MNLKSDVIKVLMFIEYTLINAASIDYMHVPEMVQNGSVDKVVLCCQYSSSLDNTSMIWLFNGNELPKQWNTSVKYSNIPSEGILNSQGTSSEVRQSQLSFQRVTAEMNGNYTCLLDCCGREVRQTKHMSVFSPENDFTLKIKYPNRHKTVDVMCTAWGLYPRPELTLEIDNRPVPKQVQRVWWKVDSFTAEGSASLRDLTGRHEVTCRLHLPQADYTAIMKKYVTVDCEICRGSHPTVTSAILLTTIFVHLANR